MRAFKCSICRQIQFYKNICTCDGSKMKDISTSELEEDLNVAVTQMKLATTDKVSRKRSREFSESDKVADCSMEVINDQSILNEVKEIIDSLLDEVQVIVDDENLKGSSLMKDSVHSSLNVQNILEKSKSFVNMR